MPASFARGLRTGVLVATALGSATARAATGSAAAGGAYVALGDSAGVGVGAQRGGYVAHLHRALRGVRADLRLQNLCRSGATSAGVLAEQVPRVAREPHALVTIGVGVNDLSRQVPAPVFAERFEA